MSLCERVSPPPPRVTGSASFKPGADLKSCLLHEFCTCNGLFFSAFQQPGVSLCVRVSSLQVTGNVSLKLGDEVSFVPHSHMKTGELNAQRVRRTKEAPEGAAAVLLGALCEVE